MPLKLFAPENAAKLQKVKINVVWLTSMHKYKRCYDIKYNPRYNPGFEKL